MNVLRVNHRLFADAGFSVSASGPSPMQASPAQYAHQQVSPDELKKKRKGPREISEQDGQPTEYHNRLLGREPNGNGVATPNGEAFEKNQRRLRSDISTVDENVTSPYPWLRWLRETVIGTRTKLKDTLVLTKNQANRAWKLFARTIFSEGEAAGQEAAITNAYNTYTQGQMAATTAAAAI